MGTDITPWEPKRPITPLRNSELSRSGIRSPQELGILATAEEVTYDTDVTYPKAPLELYGWLTTPPTKEALAARKTQHCPFLERKCVKIRKSDPQQTIGTCTVGSGGEPQISCPARFLGNNQIFEDTLHLMKSTKGEAVAVPEVGISGFGNVDFVVARVDENQINDFYALELQALDTTGSTWQGRQDFYANGGTMTPPYKYGINWKMTAKLVLVQTAHKAPLFDGWGKKLVWVMQDTLLDYMKKAFNFSGFHDEHPDHPLYFYGYKAVPTSKRFKLELVERVSGDLPALALAMGANAEGGAELLQEMVASMVKRRDRWREI